MVGEIGGKPVFNFPIRFDNAEAADGPSPALGADNARVLAPLGAQPHAAAPAG